MKQILNFSDFPNILSKRAWGTHNAPKPANETMQKSENFRIFALFHLQVWVRYGYPKPFLIKYSESLKNLESVSYLYRFHSNKSS